MPIIDPTTPSGVQPVGFSSGYTLTMSDEFNSSSLDTSKWTGTNGYASGGLPTNFDINEGGNSAMRMWPERDPAVHGTCPANTTCKNATFSTEQGNKFLQKYGFFECRMRLCEGKGQFPAFWLYKETGASYQPEIDIMEAFGHTANNGGGWMTLMGDGQWHPTNAVATLWRDGGGGTRSSSTQRKINDTPGFNTGDLSLAYHTFGCHWDANQLRFYFDGGLYWTQTSPWSSAEMIACAVLIDLWWGSNGGNPCALDGSNQVILGPGNSTFFDYVRCWQIGAGGPPPPPPPPPTFSATVTQAPANNATIAGTVPFAISGTDIRNAELLPPTGYLPSYGSFALNGAFTSGTFNWDTTTLPNGPISVRIAAFDAPPGGTGNEITAMAPRTYIISNNIIAPPPIIICTSFDII